MSAGIASYGTTATTYGRNLNDSYYAQAGSGGVVVSGVSSINGATGVVVQTGVQGINVYGNVFGVGDLLPTSVVSIGNLTGSSLTASSGSINATVGNITATAGSLTAGVDVATPLIRALSLGATAATVGRASATSGGGATKSTMVIAGWRITWGAIVVFDTGADAGRGYVDFPVPYKTGAVQDDFTYCLTQGNGNGGATVSAHIDESGVYVCNANRMSIFTSTPSTSPYINYIAIGPA